MVAGRTFGDMLRGRALRYSQELFALARDIMEECMRVQTTPTASPSEWGARHEETST